MFVFALENGKFSPLICVLKHSHGVLRDGLAQSELVVVMDFAEEFIDSPACGVQCEKLMGFQAAKAFN